MPCLVAKSCPAFLQPHGLLPSRLLCPWDFPGKYTGMGCHFLLQGRSHIIYFHLYMKYTEEVNLYREKADFPWMPWLGVVNRWQLFKSMGVYFEEIQVFWSYIEMVVAEHCECTKYQWEVHFKRSVLCYVNFISIKNKNKTNNSFRKHAVGSQEVKCSSSWYNCFQGEWVTAETKH